MNIYSLIILITICIALLYGRFKFKIYPRYTTVKRHARRGTYNGVREHHRRISDGVKIIWAPYNEMLLMPLYRKIHAKLVKNKTQIDTTKYGTDKFRGKTDLYSRNLPTPTGSIKTSGGYVKCNNCGSEYWPSYPHKCAKNELNYSKKVKNKQKNIPADPLNSTVTLRGKKDLYNQNLPTPIGSKKTSGGYVKCNSCGSEYWPSYPHKCIKKDTKKLQNVPEFPQQNTKYKKQEYNEPSEFYQESNVAVNNTYDTNPDINERDGLSFQDETLADYDGGKWGDDEYSEMGHDGDDY